MLGKSMIVGVDESISSIEMDDLKIKEGKSIKNKRTWKVYDQFVTSEKHVLTM